MGKARETKAGGFEEEKVPRISAETTPALATSLKVATAQIAGKVPRRNRALSPGVLLELIVLDFLRKTREEKIRIANELMPLLYRIEDGVTTTNEDGVLVFDEIDGSQLTVPPVPQANRIERKQPATPHPRGRGKTGQSSG